MRRWAAITWAMTARIRRLTICACIALFRVFALDVSKLDLPARFAAADAFRAMHGHVLAEAAIYVSDSLHPDVRG